VIPPFKLINRPEKPARFNASIALALRAAHLAMHHRLPISVDLVHAGHNLASGIKRESDMRAISYSFGSRTSMI